MRSVPQNRKTPHFFVINPRPDRRREARYDMEQNVVVRVLFGEEERVFPAVGFEIGQVGMKFQMGTQLVPGQGVQVSFPNTLDNVHCFGRVVWVKELVKGLGYECGVAVEEWHGITDGAQSWKKFVVRTKADRRSNRR